MPTTAQHLLDVARAEIGQTEQPRGSNRTKYGTWFGLNPAPWCSMFLCWVAHNAGAPELVAIPRRPKGSAYSGDIYDKYRVMGRVSMSPQVGDFVVWDWPNAGTANDHIGIVETVGSTGRIGTIEGNSPGSGFGFDVVGRHARDPRKSVRGYCHPAYVGAGQPRPAPPTPTTIEEDDMAAGIFITAPNQRDQWWFYDGFNRRPVGPGENQEMLNMKLVPPDEKGKPYVKPIDQARFDAIKVHADYR